MKKNRDTKVIQNEFANRVQAITRGKVVLNAWHNYCMESWIFRLFVKLRLRK